MKRWRIGIAAAALCLSGLLVAAQAQFFTPPVNFIRSGGACDTTNIVLTPASSSPWTNNTGCTNFSIRAYGGGGGGGDAVGSPNFAGGGGSGACYVQTTGYTKVASGTAAFAVGAGGVRGSTPGRGGTSYFDGANCAGSQACAFGGYGGNQASGVIGCDCIVSGCVGTTQTDGGTGAPHSTNGFAGGSGGGAGGPNGVGKNPGTSADGGAALSSASGGAGGTDGSASGTGLNAATTPTGGAGGNNFAGSGGGAGTSGSGTNANVGTTGGGASGATGSTTTGGAGAAGGNGTTGGGGSGSGGGGSGGASGDVTPGIGGTGGKCGGGGGGGADNGTTSVQGRPGGDGCIIIIPIS